MISDYKQENEKFSKKMQELQQKITLTSSPGKSLKSPTQRASSLAGSARRQPPTLDKDR
jgi:hypothetical protein